MLDCLQHVHLILYGWFLLLLWLIDELNSLTGGGLASYRVTLHRICKEPQRCLVPV